MDAVILARLPVSARHIVLAAWQIAERAGCPAVDAPHLVAAMFEDENCLACRLLGQLGQDCATAAAKLRGSPFYLSAHEMSTEGIDQGLTSRAQAFLEAALREADAYRDVAIGTEYFLLALLTDFQAEAEMLLDTTAVSVDVVHEKIRELEWPFGMGV